MSTTHKGAKFLALLAGGSIALAACSTGTDTGTADPDDTTSESSPAEGGGEEEVTTKDQIIPVAHEQEFNAYNNSTGSDSAVKNTVVLNKVLTGFFEFGEDGSVIPNEEFGTYEKVSDDPLTVEYSINPDAVWSDGEPIDCDDVMLNWASFSGAYDEGEGDTATTLFDAASTSGTELMEKPTCEEGDKDFTVVYTDTYADWIAGIGGFLPAHIAEQESGVEDIIAAVKDDDVEALGKVAEFWNTGWRFNPGELPQDIIPSSGPYKIDSWEAGQSITLTANEEYWGTPPISSTIVIRIIGQEEQAQALQNGDVLVAEPQPNPDILAQMQALGDQVTVVQGDEFTFEHLDFNFEGVFKDPALREAFALCVPRDQIVENLITPVNANAEIAQSRLVMGFQPNYEEVASAIQDGKYDTADIAAAKALVEGANAVGTEVRIGYQTPNPRRTNEVDLIRASCEQAGFKIIDHGQDDFFEAGLSGGNFDVALFAWAGSPLVTGSGSIYSTGGGQNSGKYSNPEVDKLFAELDVTPDLDEQTELIKQIETLLWDDLATIPLFNFPGIVAYDNTVDGVTFQPSNSSVTWNIQDWDLQ